MRAIYKNEEFYASIRYDLNLISIVTHEKRSEEEDYLLEQQVKLIKE